MRISDYKKIAKSGPRRKAIAIVSAMIGDIVAARRKDADL
jgi:hypothetical protein